ncbi:hypothetical protein Tco_1290398, partial [Tanacetum coccineum]
FVDDIDFAYIPTDGPATVEMVNATKDNFDVDDLVKFQELLLDAEKPLYEGCPDFTKLSAIVKLLNLKGKYGASDKFFTELLGLIKKMLPAGNEMKNDKDLTACRTCGTSRWKVDNKTKKVYKNILAKRITDGVLRHLTDSQAWHTIDEKFLEIVEYTRNLRLGISADRVDVNTGNRHHNLDELGVKPELFAIQDEDKATLPPAGYTLTNAEKDIFCETLHNIKVVGSR